jgi:vitamin B12 transporter
MRTRNIPARLAAVFAALAAVLPAAASAQSTTLRETVVTSSRTPTRIDEQLTDVTVITREDIVRSGLSNISQLLNTLPGVQATPPSTRGANASVFIRGNNNAHTLVLVDGIRVSSATTGATALQHLPLEQIERIEVLRGPASSLYGSDAIGGVIQVFTRKGSGTPAPSASLTRGSYDTTIASAGYGGKVGDTSFHLQAGIDASRGFSDIKAARGGFLDSYNPDADGYIQRNLGLNVRHRVSAPLELGLGYLRTTGRKRSDSINCDAAFTTCTANYDNRDRQQLDALNVHADYQVTPGWRSTLRAGLGRDDLQSWLYDPAANEESMPRYTTRQRQFSWQNDIQAGPGVLMAALERREVKVDSTQAFVVQEQDTNSLALGYQAWLGPHLLQASARRDRISGMDPANTGTLAYGYKFASGWVARASAGTGFHAPSFNDLYWPLDPANFFVGNPTLRPERSRNVEIGATYDSGPARASITAYRNRVKDLIEFFADPVTFLGTMRNVSSATLQGVTLAGSYRWSAWTLAGHYDLLSARNDATGNTLQRRTPRFGSVDLGHRQGKWEAGVRVQAFSYRYNDGANTQRLPGYALLDLRATYHLDPRWTLTASLQNALDKDYVVNRISFTPFSDYGTAGRSLFVGVRYQGQ